MTIIANGFWRFSGTKKIAAAFFSHSVKRQFCVSTRLSNATISRKFTNKHEWISVAGKIGTVGITNYAQEALGEIVFAQLPEVGAVVVQSKECGALESVKAASDLYSPVSGKVAEINEKVQSETSLINKSCYENGWLFKVELSKPDELDRLLDEQAYNSLVKTLQH